MNGPFSAKLAMNGPFIARVSPIVILKAGLGCDPRHNVAMTTWEDVVGLASQLPDVEVSTSYRTPALKVAGKSFARLRTEAEGGLMLLCEHAEKEALLASADPAFFTTPHYDGYGAILVDLEKVDPVQLRELIEDAWRLKAPPRLTRGLDA
jgi:hypothetical protein